MQTETLRQAELNRLVILDTPPEPFFDRIVANMAELTGCPAAAMTLLTERRQWFKARHCVNISQSRRELAFCSYAVRYPGAFEVCDAQLDRRFRANPVVTGIFNVRYYAGVPLVTRAGAKIGMLCVFDVRPRDPLADSQWRCLWSGSRAIVSAMEGRPGVRPSSFPQARTSAVQHSALYN